MLEVKISHKISEIDRDSWNNLCPDDYPFCRYEFLYALEQSGSVCARTGWQPLHLQFVEQGQITAIIPLYLKSHSYGEYVFDWAWADAYQRHGLNYYPKLVSAIPYSPVSGPRILTQSDPGPLLQQLEKLLPRLSETVGAHSWHLLFPPATEHKLLEQTDLIIRMGCQYQWFNRNYRDFDDFLRHFNARKRKNVRKERQKARQHGISHLQLSGSEISPAQMDQFYQFYRLTYLKRGQEAYLNRAFFAQLQQQMPDNLLLVLACKEGEPVAGALSLRDSRTLYGRYWGCYEEYDSLHFETCYYQGIEYCIAHQLARFDSGAQGEHKIQRGFEPVATWSAHWLEEQGFNQAIRRFAEEEAHAVSQQIEQLACYLPFRQEPS